jgi:hypothetical protein
MSMTGDLARIGSMDNRQFQCELSWSASRVKEWERCRRENWYARYGSWGWWTEQPRGEKYEITVHKCLTSLPAFTGNCMHQAIEHWFQLKRDDTTLSLCHAFNNPPPTISQQMPIGWERKPSLTMVATLARAWTTCTSDISIDPWAKMTIRTAETVVRRQVLHEPCRAMM